ncbi:MAG: TonB family protein [Imperialibacter sp.]|uniref:energy transducer TonB n=1 Tax=Imperialibacter sp. TaxID=2038411 RepID=UPI0032EBF0C9
MIELKKPVESWDEMVFAGKNRAYGAFVLRGRYALNLLSGFLAGGVCLCLLLYAPQIWQWFKKDADELKTAELKTVKYTELAPPPSIEKLITPPPKVQEVQKVVKYLPPKVTPDEVAEDNVPTVEEVKQNDTGSENMEGTGNVVADSPPTENLGAEPANEVFSVVEEMPQFDGGMGALGKYLSKNMKYPVSARRMGVEGTVYISFVVSKDGAISEVTVLKGIHTDCDQEAVRVITNMPAWKPGKQRGIPVNVKFVLPIKFKLG